MTATTIPAHPSGYALPSAFRLATRALLLGVVLQFYFAGAAMFGATSLAPHRMTGWAVQLMALLLALATAFRPWRQAARTAWAVFGLCLLQPVLAFAPRAQAPAVSALHAVNGLLILALVWRLAAVRAPAGSRTGAP